MTPNDMAAEMARLSTLLDQGLTALRHQAGNYAEAEQSYREAKAKAWIGAPQGTVPEREAHVNGETAKLRYARDLADGLRQAALEAGAFASCADQRAAVASRRGSCRGRVRKGVGP